MFHNMFHNNDALNPHPNDPAAESMNLADSSLVEAASGVYLDELPVGDVLEVETGHHIYRVENRGDGKALISGHPKYCPEPVLVDLHGSTAGGTNLKMRFIGRGLRMEFRHPVMGVICTSPVREVHELAAAH